MKRYILSRRLNTTASRRRVSGKRVSAGGSWSDYQVSEGQPFSAVIGRSCFARGGEFIAARDGRLSTRKLLVDRRGAACADGRLPQRAPSGSAGRRLHHLTNEACCLFNMRVFQPCTIVSAAERPNG